MAYGFNEDKSVVPVYSVEDVDRKTIASALQNPVFTPYTRYIFEDVGSVYTSHQVSTMDDEEQYFYVITPYAASDQATTKESVLRVISPQGGTLLALKELPVGHGRSLTCKNEILLTSNQYAEENNEWVAISISDRTDPTLVSTGNFNGRHLFWTDDGAACYTGQNTIKFFDVEWQDGVPVSFTENGKTLTFPVGIRGEEQSFQWWNGFIIIASTLPETITVIDGYTGAIVSQTLLEQTYSFMHTAELESAFIINNHLYFSNNSGVSKTESDNRFLECGLFRCDFFEPKGEFYDYWRQNLYQGTRGSTQYVSGQKPAISSVSSDGSNTNPFWFVEDALVSYVSKKRAHFRIDTHHTIGIVLDTEQYDHIINIANTDVVVGINGKTNSRTSVYGIKALNTKLTLNRLDIRGGTNFSNLTNIPCGIHARWSEIVLLATAFTNQASNAVDISAQTACVIRAQVDLGLVRSDASEICAQSFNKTPQLLNGGMAYSYLLQSPYSAAAIENFSAGCNPSNTNNWINLARVDDSMYRLFFDQNSIRLAYYPDYKDLSNSQTLGTCRWDA